MFDEGIPLELSLALNKNPEKTSDGKNNVRAAF